MLGDIEKPILMMLGAYVVIGLIVTRGIALDVGLTVLQKIAQVLIIWLIPVFGICLVLVMQGNNHTRSEMKNLVPFPFYLVAHSSPGDSSLANLAQDGVGEHCGGEAADAD